MKYQRNVKHARFQFRVRLIRAKHKEQILCCGQSLLRTVDIKAVITDIMVVCMVTLLRKHLEDTDQLDALF